MNTKYILSKYLPLASLVLPYYGLIDECVVLMQCLSKKTRKLWQSNEEILMRIIDKRRVLKMEYLNENVIRDLDVKQLKYYMIETKHMQEFLKLLISSQDKFVQIDDQTGAVEPVLSPQNSIQNIPSLPFLENYSVCPNYLYINGHKFDLNDMDTISQFAEEQTPKEVMSQLLHIMTKSGNKRSPKTDFISEFTLTDSTEISLFHSYPRRIKQLEVAAMNFQKQDPFWDQTPFINEIGVLRVEVKSISFLKHFFNTCDTKVREIKIVETPQLNKDIFLFQEELSRALNSSVKKVVTNKYFEKSCRRFENCESFEVANFYTLVNILTGKNKSLRDIRYVTE